MTTLGSMPAQTMNRNTQEGYVLVFTLSVLLFISVLVLGLASALRMDAQLTLHEKRRWQSEFVARGAIEYLMAQLSVTDTLDRIAAVTDPRQRNNEPGRWRVDGRPYTIRVGEHQATVVVEDAAIRPDMNLLTPDEWERLFLLGMEMPPDLAQTLARRVLTLRAELPSGFASLHDLTRVSGLSLAQVYGRRGQPQVALKDLISAGTGYKKLNVNLSPLILFRIIANFTDQQVGDLAQERKARAQESPPRLLTAEEVAGRTGASPSLFYAGVGALLSVQVMTQLGVDAQGAGGTAGGVQMALISKTGTGYGVTKRWTSPVAY